VALIAVHASNDLDIKLAAQLFGLTLKVVLPSSAHA